MVETAIRLFFQNLALVLLVAALFAGWLSGRRPGRSMAEELFRYMAVLSVGPGFLMAFLMHAFAPQLPARTLGWAVSPFQAEVAVANLSVAVLGFLSFRASRGFRLAMVVALCCWQWGAAAGHVNQMVKAGNFSSGNAGVWFWLDVLAPILMIVLYRAMSRKEAVAGSAALAA